RGAVCPDPPPPDAPSPPTTPAAPPAGTRCASYSQSSPHASYAARCSTGDSECAIGSPTTPQIMGSEAVGLGLAVLLQLALEGQELVVVVGELGLAGLEVGGHVEEPR